MQEQSNTLAPRTPSRFLAAHLAATPRSVRLAHIAIEDETFRFRVRLRVRSLARDIERNGQQFPVLLRSSPGTERLQVVCGFRRIHAIRSLGWSSVLAVVADLDDVQAYRISRIENEERSQLSDLDRAHMVLKARRVGIRWKELESVFGLCERQLRRLQRLVDLDPILLEALDAGRIHTTTACRLARLKAANGDAVDLRGWVDTVEREQLSGAQLERRVKAELRKMPRPLFCETRDGALRVRATTFDPLKMSESERAAAIRSYQGLINLLRNMAPEIRVRPRLCGRQR